MRFDHKGHLRVEVVDQGSGFIPVARDRPATDVEGWGLAPPRDAHRPLGVHAGSTHVWSEIERP